MCGLVGMFLPASAPIVMPDLGAMLGVLRHRGPDAIRHHVSEDGRFRAGFARLAIIDLETGDQPLVEEDGSHVFLGNGEIYNYRELRAELRERGHRFHTEGDMEVALKAFREWGIEFTSRLNGMFAVAIYERAAGRLTLIRDHFGIKPLYWAALPGGGVLFGSEIKALFASGLIEPKVDESRIATWLAHGYVPGPETLFMGINKLQPAHWLRIDDAGRTEAGRYWTPAANGTRPQDAEEASGVILRELRRSVRLQLRSDVPLGALLSGGIDSGLIVALAAEASSAPLKTYTVRFGGRGVDETPLAAMVAKRYGTEHREIDVPVDMVAAHLPTLAWYCDEPLTDASLLPNFLVNAELGKDIRVVLNGTGGDELFAGYRRHFPLPVERLWLDQPAWARRIALKAVRKVRPMMAWRLERAELLEADWGQYLHEHSTLFPGALRAGLGFPDQVRAAQSLAFGGFAGPPETGLLAAEMETYLAEDLLVLLDRSTMAAGVEGRVPFLDPWLAEAALSVPPDIRAPGGRQKALERQIAREFLPEAVLNAPKQGFASPVPDWIAGDIGALCRRVLEGRQARERGWFNQDTVTRMLYRPQKYAFQLFALLMLELTVRTHVDRRDAVPPSLGDLLGDD